MAGPPAGAASTTVRANILLLLLLLLLLLPCCLFLACWADDRRRLHRPTRLLHCRSGWSDAAATCLAVCHQPRVSAAHDLSRQSRRLQLMACHSVGRCRRAACCRRRRRRCGHRRRPHGRHWRLGSALLPALAAPAHGMRLLSMLGTAGLPLRIHGGLVSGRSEVLGHPAWQGARQRSNNAGGSGCEVSEGSWCGEGGTAVLPHEGCFPPWARSAHPGCRQAPLNSFSAVKVTGRQTIKVIEGGGSCPSVQDAWREACMGRRQRRHR